MKKLSSLLLIPCFVWIVFNLRPSATAITRPELTQWELDAMMKQDDIVVIRSDADIAEHGWGIKGGLAPVDGGSFARIHITDKTWAQAKKYTESHNVGYYLERKWNVLRSELPSGVKQQINQTGEYETDWATIKGFIHDKVNDQTE